MKIIFRTQKKWRVLKYVLTKGKDAIRYIVKLSVNHFNGCSFEVKVDMTHDVEENKNAKIEHFQPKQCS